MANGDPVTHRELSKLLLSQTERLEGKIDRSEDRLRGDIREVRTGCEDDNKQVSDRVTKLEDYNRKQNFVGVVLGAVVAALAAFFKGG
ncbi:MAG: hypothetical protein ACXAEN_24240 [Candidatus Thorarchaeota archaeon]|jgi:gas vesicle protein